MSSMHPLDRPIWHALTTRQADLAIGEGSARRFKPDYAPFAAAADDSPESLRALADLIGPADSVMLLQRGESPLPPGTSVESAGFGLQLLFDKLPPEQVGIETARSEAPVEKLGEANAAEIFDLAQRTQPGPFRARTHQLGDFYGIRRGGQLVAMAGERMKLDGYAEVSGVATDPHFRGRGYAAQLTLAVVEAILARGEVPFLHAYAGNTSAIALYQRIGFVIRCPVTVATLVRAVYPPR